MSTKRKGRAESATDKVKLADLMQADFQASLQTLISLDPPIKAAYMLLETCAEVVKQQKYFEQIRMQILDKYAKKTASGEFEMNAEKNMYVLDDKAAFDKEYAELMAIEVNIPKVPLSYLGEIRIPPLVLKPLINTVISPRL